jgi:hypothetical protein
VELKEKDVLLNNKYSMLAQHPEFIGKKMEVEE